LSSCIIGSAGQTSPIAFNVPQSKRLHSALGYCPPNDFEELLLTELKEKTNRQTLLTLPVQT